MHFWSFIQWWFGKNMRILVCFHLCSNHLRNGFGLNSPWNIQYLLYIKLIVLYSILTVLQTISIKLHSGSFVSCSKLLTQNLFYSMLLYFFSTSHVDNFLLSHVQTAVACFPSVPTFSSIKMALDNNYKVYKMKNWRFHNMVLEGSDIFRRWLSIRNK